MQTVKQKVKQYLILVEPNILLPIQGLRLRKLPPNSRKIGLSTELPQDKQTLAHSMVCPQPVVMESGEHSVANADFGDDEQLVALSHLVDLRSFSGS